MVEAASYALQNEMTVGGESVHKFEEAFARYIGTDHAISTSSGTDALILSLIAADVRGSKVITSPFTFIASCNAIVHSGGIPILADIKTKDCTIDPKRVIEKTDEGTRGILPIHIFGRPCAMDEIVDIADATGSVVIEDACQAHGAKYRGKRVGGLGDIGCFSFYPTKNMTVGGDGGMVTTNDDCIAERVRKLRDCGRKERYLHDMVGFTSRLNTVNAAIGLVQLRRLDDWNLSRVRAAKTYDRLLSDLEMIQRPPMNDSEYQSVFHLYSIRCDDRNGLQRHLIENGVSTAIHYPVPVNMQPVYADDDMGSFPISEMAASRSISLPMYPEITDTEIGFVCDMVHQFFQKG